MSFWNIVYGKFVMTLLLAGPLQFTLVSGCAPVAQKTPLSQTRTMREMERDQDLTNVDPIKNLAGPETQNSPNRNSTPEIEVHDQVPFNSEQLEGD